MVTNKVLVRSSITDIELIKITSSFNVIHEDRFDCSKCMVAGNEAKRRSKGCFGLSEKTLYTGDGIEFFTCVGNMRDPTFHYLFEFYKTYKTRTLDIRSMPAKLVEMMQLLDNLTVGKEIENHKKAERRARNGKRR